MIRKFKKKNQWWQNWFNYWKISVEIHSCSHSDNKLPNSFFLALFYEKLIFSSNLQESLGQTFDMEKPAVHAIVAKMIISEELMASMDEPSECMIMHRTEPSRLQSLSLQLSDKLAQLVENNERLLELRPGGMIFRFHFYTKQYKLNKLYKKNRKIIHFYCFLYAKVVTE